MNQLDQGAEEVERSSGLSGQVQPEKWRQSLLPAVHVIGSVGRREPYRRSERQPPDRPAVSRAAQRQPPPWKEKVTDAITHLGWG